MTNPETTWECQIAHAARQKVEAHLNAARIPTSFHSTLQLIVETALHSVRTATETDRRAAHLVRESTGISIFLLDSNGTLVFWNRGAERLYGYTVDEVLGRHYGDLFRAEERAARLPETLLREAATSERSEKEMWQVRRDGSAFCTHTVVTPLPGDGSNGRVQGYACSVRDATAEVNERDRLRRSERAAQKLETTFLPAIRTEILDGIEVATFYAAAWSEARIGGDFFDAFPLPDGSLAFVVGDASGKGLEAAGRAAEVRLLLRAFLRECPVAADAPALALARLNTHLYTCFHLDRLPGDTFTAVTLAVFCPATETLYVANAGGEPPVHIAAAPGTVRLLDNIEHGPVLGIMPDATYGVLPLTFAPEDQLLLFTDGLTEARPSSGPLFGIESILDRAVTGASPESQGRTLLAAARAHAGGTLQDDVCLLALRRHPEHAANHDPGAAPPR